MADDSHTLKPVKFGTGSLGKRSTNKTDQFGQQYSASQDESKWSNQSPEDSRKAHSRSDVDTGPSALHHTIGNKHNQASPGDHIHEGKTSKKLGPMMANPAFNPALPVSSSNKQFIPEWHALPTGASIIALLHNFIEFRDV
jgi:hypothetical protein